MDTSMQFSNITHDKETHYPLKGNEKRVFFMLNRSGNITFDLMGRGSEAHIFSLQTGKENTESELIITQNHHAPKSVSSFLGKVLATDHSRLSLKGKIHIGKKAVGSDASQELRTLLAAPTARASVEPTLEIETDEVRCRHAASTGSINDEALYTLMTRGLSEKKAKELLEAGFIQELMERLENLGIPEEKLTSFFEQVYAE